MEYWWEVSASTAIPTSTSGIVGITFRVALIEKQNQALC